MVIYIIHRLSETMDKQESCIETRNSPLVNIIVQETCLSVQALLGFGR